jgi:hypothetical protein
MVVFSKFPNIQSRIFRSLSVGLLSIILLFLRQPQLRLNHRLWRLSSINIFQIISCLRYSRHTRIFNAKDGVLEWIKINSQLIEKSAVFRNFYCKCAEPLLA